MRNVVGITLLFGWGATACSFGVDLSPFFSGIGVPGDTVGASITPRPDGGDGNADASALDDSGYGGSGTDSSSGAGRDAATCAPETCPRVLATNQALPFALALSPKEVFWTNTTGGEVMRVAKDGATPPELVATAQGKPRGIAVTPQYVYWANLAGPMKRADLSCKAGTCIETFGFGGTGVHASRLRSDSDWIWFFQVPGAYISRHNVVTRAVENVASTGVNNFGIAVGANSIFFSGYEADPALWRYNRATKIADVLDNHRFPYQADLAVDASYLYVALDVDASVTSGPSVVGIALDGSTNSLTVATSQKNVVGIAVDNVYVYWTAREDGAVRRRRKDATGPIEDIVVGELKPTDLAIDDTSIYWLTASEVHRRAKP